MAHLFVNRCLHGKCQKVFASVHDLIVHIEDVHIDFDPKAIAALEETKPLAVPLSLVLRYNNDDDHEPSNSLDPFTQTSFHFGRAIREDSKRDKAHTMSKEFSPNLLQHGNNWYSPEIPQSSSTTDSYKHKMKRYSCPVTGCTKKYKNLTGMRHHIVNNHDVKGNTIKPKKEYKCYCGKEYKTIRGMQSHTLSHKESMTARAGHQFEHYKMKTNYMRTNMHSRLYPNLLHMDGPKCSHENNNNKEKSLNYTTLADRHSFGAVDANKRLNVHHPSKDINLNYNTSTTFGDVAANSQQQETSNMYSGAMYHPMGQPLDNEISNFTSMFGKIDFS